MPTYEYECQSCGHRFEKFQSMTDEPAKRCPECRCKVKRLFGTGSGILFKGSGFYQTDYRSSNYVTAAKKEKNAADGSTSDTSTTSAKSETKSKTKTDKS